MDAAHIVGVSDQKMRRRKARYEVDGADAVRDHREGKVPKNRIAEATMARVLELYGGEYAGFNVQHSWEQLGEYGIKVSYSWTKALLHDAALVRRGQKRKVYRRRREREAMVGMMLHLDGSKHRWFASEKGAMQALVGFVDDATGEVFFPLFVPEESTRLVLGVLREVVEEHGAFGRLYTDRASHFVSTPKAGEGPYRIKKTQVERVLDEFGNTKHTKHLSARRCSSDTRVHAGLLGR